LMIAGYMIAPLSRHRSVSRPPERCLGERCCMLDSRRMAQGQVDDE
jgi:hypothetical protein